MSDTVIRSIDLSKQFKLGGPAEPYSTLRESLLSALRAPLRWLKGGPPPDPFWALKDVNFEVAEGDVVAVIGRNGAGKSTLLKILSEIMEPTSGRVEITGRVASLLEVGTGFHPELTGRENVYLNGAILGMGRAEIDRKFDAIVDFAEVERFIDTPVKRYSSGMHVRLAFAVAAHLNPEILIVDEVLAVGDVAFQNKCLGKMEDVSRSGRTVLFVSHSMGAVKQLCNRGILLEKGQVAVDGTVDEAVQTYLAAGASTDDSGEIPETAPRRCFTGHCRFTQIFIRDVDGVPARRYFMQDPMQVRISVEVYTILPTAVLEVGIVATDGTYVVLALSTDNGGVPRKLEPGTHEVSVWLKLDLLPRGYTICLAIHDSNGNTFDRVDRTIDFEVLRTNRSGDSQWRFDYVPAYAHMEAEWRFDATATPAIG